jgi:4,5-DOPA dioxygenase extradiol
MSASQPLPPLFISHGSPMTALDPGAAGAFWTALGPRLDAAFGRPRAVLVASAHSLTREPVLLAAERHEAVYDFGGFDPRLNTLRYDAPGDPDLAGRARALLSAAGLRAHVVAEGGLDHGIWVPLRAMWPAADVPVLPLAWPPQATPAALAALGRALAPLATEGVLVMGSGSITHNLRAVFAGGLHGTPRDAAERPESAAFRAWWAARAEDGDAAALERWADEAPHAQRMHPSSEHLLPWFIAAGAAGFGDASSAHPAGAPVGATRLHSSVTHAELGMDAYAFGPLAPRLLAAT